MKHFARGAALLAVLALALAAGAAPASAAKPVQLALGDSWAWGYGATVPAEGGYVPVLHEALQAEFDCSPSPNPKPEHACKQLELINLAVPGATTPSLIADQLPAALEVLESHNGDRNPRNDVAVVTLHIGGNDVTGPIIGACLSGLSATCVQVIQREFSEYRADLETVLSALREAAGPDTRIVIGTYDNPFTRCSLGSIPGAIQLAALVLEGGAGLEGLHDVMRDVAADYGVEVAEAFGDLTPADWVGGNDCLHPRDSGYAKVAAAFAEVLQN